MNKYGIAEQVIRLLYPNATKDIKTSIPQVALYVGQARDRIIRNTVWKSFSDGDPVVLTDYIQAYENVEVKYDSVRKLHYCNLPVGVVELPREMGINHVACMDNIHVPFIPSQFGFRSVSIYGDMGRMSYYPERDRLYLSGITNTNEKLFLRLVPRGQDIDILEDFNFPPDQEADLIETALRLFVGQREMPSDVLNNTKTDPA